MNRRSICFVLSLLFALFSFSGCRNSVCHTTTLKADEIIAETDNHIVYRVGDLYYIEFFNELTGEFNDISSRDASIPFNSMSELREFILENKFDATQQKDFEDSSENGAIEIINVEHLWVPVYPDDVKLVESYWFTRRYAFVFESNCARYINHVFYANSEEPATDEEEISAKAEPANGTVETLLPTTESRQYIRSYYVGQSDEKKDVYVYVYYTLDDGKTTVSESYWYHDVEPDFEIPKNGIPKVVYIICKDENLVCTKTFHSFSTRPTEEWLMSFGMEPYVPEEN
ncbi:MAG: hypothetical protein J6W15_04670 [Clostridia bacterium]|nr:hypothetical protein [Clostridia bacterium]